MKQRHDQPNSQRLAADAQSLLAATAVIAEAKVASARQRLAEAIEHGKETLANVQDKAVAGAKATDRAIRKHPYPAMGVALGVGALIGFWLARRKD